MMLKWKKLMAVCFSSVFMTTFFAQNAFALKPPENSIQEAVDWEKSALIQNVGENGIVEDLAQQCAEFEKTVVRASFKFVVAGGNAAGLTAAATLLDHSLQDDPTDLYYSGDSEVGRIIANSREYQELVDDFKRYLLDTALNAGTISGSTTLDSTTDLHLSFNKVNDVVSGTRDDSTGVWTVEVIFEDRYDFERMAWSNGQLLVAIINNYAYYAQSIGAIVPYDVQISITTTFAED